MTLLVVLLVALAVLAGCLVVLFRRQRLNKGADEWTHGAERLPSLSERADTAPHVDGSAGTGIGVVL
jgi:hypothetical protein